MSLFFPLSNRYLIQGLETFMKILNEDFVSAKLGSINKKVFRAEFTHREYIDYVRTKITAVRMTDIVVLTG